jgi:hypothetical protein
VIPKIIGSPFRPIQSASLAVRLIGQASIRDRLEEFRCLGARQPAERLQ